MSLAFWLPILIPVVINLLLLAAGWGRLEAARAADRERANERHDENQGILKEIRAEVKSTNGHVNEHESTLREHTSTLRDHEREINRLRDRGDR